MAKQKAKIAPIFVRFKAFIIDIFLIAMPLLYGTTYLILGSREALWHNQRAIFAIWGVYGIITAFLQSKFAQTPGLRAQNAYLIDTRTGKKASFAQTIFRFALFFALGWTFFVCFFRQDRLNFYDIFSRTAVIIKKSSEI